MIKENDVEYKYKNSFSVNALQPVTGQSYLNPLTGMVSCYGPSVINIWFFEISLYAIKILNAMAFLFSNTLNLTLTKLVYFLTGFTSFFYKYVKTADITLLNLMFEFSVDFIIIQISAFILFSD